MQTKCTELRVRTEPKQAPSSGHLPQPALHVRHVVGGAGNRGLRYHVNALLDVRDVHGPGAKGTSVSFTLRSSGCGWSDWVPKACGIRECLERCVDEVLRAEGLRTCTQGKPLHQATFPNLNFMFAMLLGGGAGHRGLRYYVNALLDARDVADLAGLFVTLGTSAPKPDSCGKRCQSPPFAAAGAPKTTSKVLEQLEVNLGHAIDVSSFGAACQGRTQRTAG